MCRERDYPDLSARQVVEQDDYSCSATKPCSNGKVLEVSNAVRSYTFLQVHAARRRLAIVVSDLTPAVPMTSRPTMYVGVIVMRRQSAVGK